MNKYNFIKTSDEETKNTLIKLGFELILEDGNVSTFLNKNILNFSDKNIKITYSDILTF